jgi:hypothetical protein
MLRKRGRFWRGKNNAALLKKSLVTNSPQACIILAEGNGAKFLGGGEMQQDQGSGAAERPRGPIEILPPVGANDEPTTFYHRATYGGRGAFEARLFRISPVTAAMIGAGALVLFGVLLLFLTSALFIIAPVLIAGAFLGYFGRKLRGA